MAFISQKWQDKKDGYWKFTVTIPVQGQNGIDTIEKTYYYDTQADVDSQVQKALAVKDAITHQNIDSIGFEKYNIVK